MVRCVCNHAAYFHIHVSAWALSGAFYETGFRECAAFLLPPASLAIKKGCAADEVIQVHATEICTRIFANKRAESGNAC